ncbi:MAG TPA: hypothetical protein VNO70_06615 [Blastocatellia bacterium]|nr:hypothetical protein [Blastocatellia bacterium]
MIQGEEIEATRPIQWLGSKHQRHSISEKYPKKLNRQDAKSTKKDSRQHHDSLPSWYSWRLGG